MPVTVSPLRYPGGKSKLYKFVRALLQRNYSDDITYIEPFAGGAGLALKLLLNHDVERIIINDSDPAIYAVWHTILHNHDSLCRFIEEVPVTIDSWNRYHEIYISSKENIPLIDLAKATFFLNRTNVSGVIKGGVIGGKLQNGKYKIDARFNKKDLINKIEKIHFNHSRIILYNQDVLELFDKLDFNPLSTFINFDPPYVKKAGSLYMNYFTFNEHRKLNELVKKCKYKWIVTYDKSQYIYDLYKNFRCSLININYSARSSMKADELIFFSDNLELDKNLRFIDRTEQLI